MAVTMRALQGQKRPTVVYAVAVAGIVLLLVAAFAFVNSVAVGRITNNARALHWANAAIGTSALTRAGLVQATTFAELADLGIATDADLAFAMEQIELAQSELESLVAIGESRESFNELSGFAGEVEMAVNELNADDVDAAKQRIRTDLEGSYIDLTDALSAEHALIVEAIDTNSAVGRSINGWVTFFLTLAVPGSAIAVYFVIARRQVRAHRERADIELEAQHAIGKAKDEFIAGLSHELRTPLTSIFGYAAIQADHGIQGAEAVAETGQIIANEAAEMTRMVDDLLVASRLESTGVEIENAPLRLNDIIESAATPFQRAGHVVECQPTAVLVDADGPRLRHVLVNLLSNAVTHGGPSVGVNVEAGDEWIEIEVWDNGRGLPAEQVDTLFEKYVHTGDAPLLTGSIGLGMAVAARLTGLMGGELKYQRFANKSFFVVSLRRSITVDSSDSESDDDVASMIRALSG
jgi:signal transduction histidine kinase